MSDEPAVALMRFGTRGDGSEVAGSAWSTVRCGSSVEWQRWAVRASSDVRSRQLPDVPVVWTAGVDRCPGEWRACEFARSTVR